jgi:uncharacterized protein (DUF58 family)
VNARAPYSYDLNKQIRRIEMRTRHKVEDLFAGSYRTVFKGHGNEINEMGSHQSGDDGRMGEQYAKRFLEERELTVLLMVDVSGSQDFSSAVRYQREAVAEMAALLAFAASHNNDKVGLLLFTDRVEKTFPPRKGRLHILRLVREVLTFQPAGHGTDLKAVVDYSNRTLKRGGIVFMLPDFQADPETYRKALIAGGGRYNLTAIHLSDAREKNITPMGLMILEDGEMGKPAEMEPTDRAWRREFKTRQEQRDATMRLVLNSAKFERIDPETPDDFANTLTRFFHNRMRRQGH